MNWAPVNNALDRGEVRAMAWQAVGHGADAVLYWQWRSAFNGQEQYHGTLVGPTAPGADVCRSPANRQRIRESRELYAAPLPSRRSPCCTPTTAAGPSTFSATPQNMISLKCCSATTRLCAISFHRRRCQRTDAPLDATSWSSHQLSTSSARSGAVLLEYVRDGGHLVLGPRSGMKDEYNALTRAAARPARRRARRTRGAILRARKGFPGIGRMGRRTSHDMGGATENL